ncbi:MULTISPECIES: Flp family type IVb pilin [unclassified Gilliamella]|uniref:Flp family type IVb pilin n=1 Tax=unclassified Gilliamella TaxID=2685620 RepID=UPI001C400703|nr:Flp family type IVb pilin [Gilliamella apicola]MCO6547004.1 Flp family type IVb pilin [Gilliamella sp.]MCO6554634.1 Flp family type IVb pilin [Gilliamella sp.]
MMYLSAIRAQARNFLGKFVKNEQGVTAIEYAIVAAGVATVVFVVFKGDGPVATMLSDVFSTLKTKVTSTINAVSTAG